MSQIKVSVIVATYNGAKKISRLLDALIMQSESDFETVIVIDGSTDNTLQILKEYKSRFTVLKIIEQANSGRSKARNRGAIEASSEFLIFYDDDMEPATDSVKKHLHFLKENQNGILTGNQIEVIRPDKTDIQNYKAMLSQYWISGYSLAMTKLTTATLFFTAANCSLSKKNFNRLGGFDERLTDAEDHDLAYRALQIGISVYFDIENEAIHNDPITCLSYIRRLREYQLAHNILKNLYPDRNHTRRYNETNVLKRFIYRLFAQPFMVRLVDNEVLLFLPKRIRYKLYTVVIHSLANVFPSIAL